MGSRLNLRALVAFVLGRDELQDGFRSAWGFTRPLGPRDRKTYRDQMIETEREAGRWSERESIAMYQVFIDYVRHENDLINHRTTWFLAIQGLTSAGAGFLLNGSASIYVHSLLAPNLALNMGAAKFLLMWLLVAMAGILSAAAARRSIDAALHALDTLDAHWCAHAHPDIAAHFPAMMGGMTTPKSNFGGSFAIDLPSIALTVWRLLVLVPVLALVIKLVGHLI